MAFPPPPHTFFFHSNEHSHDPLPSPNSSLTSFPLPQLFPGNGAHLMMQRSVSFSGVEKCEEVHGDDDLSDDGSQLGEKKKRLNMEQVKALEKSFELGNKLEPERKMQLAKALGLQPRQIAIWFQNRRARWKTKQLEKDYDVLKRQFDALKADNDVLHAKNKKLHAELLNLRNTRDSNEDMNLKKENHEGSWSNGSENSCDVNLDITRTTVTTAPISPQFITKHLFATTPPSLMRPASMTQLLHHGSARPDLHQLVPDENFCSMFNVEDQQQGFWPWSSHDRLHQFH